MGSVPPAVKETLLMGRRHRTNIINTTLGPVRGFEVDGVQNFLGIPYATPPVGRLRWRPPEQLSAWNEPLDAVTFGGICAQTSECFPGFASDSLNEDCLYLNVCRPASQTAPKDRPKLPVMVWFHGGGFACGASNDYDPTKLVQDGQVVFVSMNYRVGMLGFFSHPEINAEDHLLGNYGIMDQHLALRWIKANIEAFGGDPDNVTAFGESAGGACILAHMTATSSQGFFHKAIIQSGGSPPTMLFPDLKSLESMGVALASASLCTNQTADELRQIPIERLMAANRLDEGAFGIGRFPFGLMEDGTVVPRDLRTKFLDGQFSRIPMILGVNKDEFTWFSAMMELRSGRILSAESYSGTVASTIDLLNRLHLNGIVVPHDAIPDILKMYPVDYRASPSRSLAAMVGDGGLISTAGRRTARILARHVPKIFVYEFDVPDTPCPYPEVSFPYGSAHTLELPYIFPGFRGGTGVSRSLNESQEALADLMVRYWTTFAWYGIPNDGSRREGSSKFEVIPKMPVWQEFSAQDDNVLLLQAGRPSRMIQSWGSRHNSDYWDQFY